jgi:uncharacterized protein (DUF1684 family)
MLNVTAFFLLLSVFAGKKDYDQIMASNLEFRNELNAEFADSSRTPLLLEDWQNFIELPFYDIDTAFYIIADFKRMKRSKPFEMATTTDRKPIYKLYGIATFKIKGESFQLHIYQNQKLKKNKKYEDYLFLPFADLTAADDTYPGGRFIDLKIPKGKTIVIDFNKAYNPLCAYNHKYSCPIPPQENHLATRIEAGVKYVAH